MPLFASHKWTHCPPKFLILPFPLALTHTFCTRTTSYWVHPQHRTLADHPRYQCCHCFAARPQHRTLAKFSRDRLNTPPTLRRVSPTLTPPTSILTTKVLRLPLLVQTPPPLGATTIALCQPLPHTQVVAFEPQTVLSTAGSDPFRHVDFEPHALSTTELRTGDQPALPVPTYSDKTLAPLTVHTPQQLDGGRTLETTTG